MVALRLKYIVNREYRRRYSRRVLNFVVKIGADICDKMCNIAHFIANFGVDICNSAAHV